MKNLCFALAALLCLVAASANAQIVASSPSPLQEESTGVVITFNAASPLGNNGLKDLPAQTYVYAHVGVITNLSTGPGDWRHVVAPWPDGNNNASANQAKNRLTAKGNNLYELAIGQLRTYFGLTDTAETIKEVVFVFRTADGKREGKTADGSDIRLTVAEPGFQIDFTCDAASYIISEPTTVNFALSANRQCELTIAVDGTTIAQAASTSTLTATHTFATSGDYFVVATAKNGTETRTETINIAFPGQPQQERYPGGTPHMGAVKNADGSVTFCLAAPGKTSVMLVPSWDNYGFFERNQMKCHDYDGNRYFWLTVEGLDDDQWYPYYYVVDGKYRVADPYAHLVLDCYNDKYIDSAVWPDMPQYPLDKVSGTMLAVYRGDMDNYNFAPFQIPAHENLVIYELLLRDFTGTDGQALGNGTLRQAIEKIPHLRALGVNAVELMPIMEFNGNNSWGYNTNFYMAPDKAYGSPTDYKDFVDECHRNGMAVILDVVFNQSDGLHPWYQMYTPGSNPFYNKNAPHDYSVLNDWNQGNPLVQQQWTDALTYWMTAYNVDGFRFDLVKGLGNNDSYAAGTEAFNQSRVDNMTRLHQVIKSVKPNGIHINENLAGAEEETALGNDGQLQWANLNHPAGQFAMGYPGGCNLYRFLSASDGGRPKFSTVAYAESHDEERLGFKNAVYGTDAVKNESAHSFNRLGTLAVQMLLTPGPKMIWQFGEFGNSQTTKNADGSNNTDPKTVDWAAWTANPDRAALNATYAAIGNLRRNFPDLFSAEATFVPSYSSDFATPHTLRLYNGDKEVLAFINPATGDEPLTGSIYTTKTKVETAGLIAASPGFEPSLVKQNRNLTVAVPPGCFAVYASEAVAGIQAPSQTPAVKVYARNSGIVIEGAYTHACAYDLAGRSVNLTNLPAGIYLVVVDGATYKIPVR